MYFTKEDHDKIINTAFGRRDGKLKRYFEFCESFNGFAATASTWNPNSEIKSKDICKAFKALEEYNGTIIELDISLDGFSCSKCGGDTVETKKGHKLIKYCPKCYKRGEL